MIRATFACVLTLAALALAPAARAEIEIQTVTSPGGITAWLVEEPSIPFTALEIRFKGGTSLDRAGKRGEVNLMAALLEEGAGDLDAQGFAAAREGLAAHYGFEAGPDAVSVSARFLTENRAAAVDLLESALTETRFDADAVERVKGQVQSLLRSKTTDPGEIAVEAARGLMWGEHPYASSGDGTPESVAALTAQDMIEARDRAIARDRIFVGAVGDITPAQLGGLLDDLFSDLPESGAEMPGQAPYAGRGGTTVIPFDTPQSVALFGHAGIARDDPDFIPAYIVNEIFGGDAEARLMREVREKRGLTYGVGTWLQPMEHGALLMGQLASANDRMGDALGVIRDEWTRMGREGVTAEELARAKTYLTGGYALRFDGNARIADILVAMQMQGLGPEYVTERNAMVEAVTLEEANRVARALYDPEALRIVVVGRPEGVTPTD